jgi:hypothetical protein
MLARAGVLLAAAARCEGRAAAHATATFASSTAPAAGKEAAKPGAAVSVAKDWKAVQLPKDVDIPAITEDPGQGFLGDIRSTSGLGMGDGLKTHTDKWLQVCMWGGWAALRCHHRRVGARRSAAGWRRSARAGAGVAPAGLLWVRVGPRVRALARGVPPACLAPRGAAPHPPQPAIGWLQGDQKSPMDYISGTEPIKVSGAVVASYGSE